MIAAGVDGCKKGWVVASRKDGGEIVLAVYPTFERVLAEGFDIIAVDVPIGLVDGDPHHRPCDREAKAALGARHVCVFYAPLRSAVVARDYEDAKALSTSRGAKALSIQSWCIVPKIREVDEAIKPSDQHRVFEVHPEMTFCAMNSGTPLSEKKSSPAGKAARRQLIKTMMGFDPFGFTVRGIKPAGAGVDDIYDAFAALWSAERILRRDARPIPQAVSHDPRGLRMAIWV